MGKWIAVVRGGAIAVSCLAVGLTFVGLHLARTNALELWTAGDAWSAAGAVIWTAAAVSGVSLGLAALWLTHRLPNNPTGWWLSVSALAFAGWMAGSMWPGPVSPYAQHLLPPIYKAAAVLAVLPWPTGRMERRWASGLTAAVTTYVSIGLIAPFIGAQRSEWRVLGWTLPSFGNLVAGWFTDAVVAVLLGGIGPAVLLGALIRRQRTLPARVRPSVRPAFLGAGVLAVVELAITVSDLAISPGLGQLLRANVPSRLVAARTALDIGRFAVVAGLLVVAESIRRRHAAVDRTPPGTVEIGPVEARAVDVAQILGDPTARLVMVDEHGISESGARVLAGSTGQAAITLADRAGKSLAHVWHDADVLVTAPALDALVAGVELEVAWRTRRAAADDRTAQVRSVQRRILEAQDHARQQLERDLHDGVQQRLVALSLQASMAARHEGEADTQDHAARDELRRGIVEAATLMRDIVGEGPPAVLRPGFAAGLVALDSTIPVRSSLELDGDVAATDPAAAALWFVAAEAVSNGLKHANATEISLRLHVNGSHAELRVRDNGVGGSPSVPAAIVRRLQRIPCEIVVDSPPGQGTVVSVRVELLVAALAR